MNKLIIIGIGCLLVGGIVMHMIDKPMYAHSRMLAQVASHEDIKRLFPTSEHEIETRVAAYLGETQESLHQILAIPADQRTYINTMHAFDYLCAVSNAMIMHTILTDLEMVSPEKELRTAAHDAALKIHEFFIDAITMNVDLYHAIKEYAGTKAPSENLTAEQRYFIKETIDDFKRHGLDLPVKKRAEVAQLMKEINALELAFEKNIAEDASTIAVSREKLKGVDEDFINSLKKDEQGCYILGVDYPTVHMIMENCAVEDTRRELYLIFNTRAYPANEAILEEVIAKRDALARMLGFESYAHLDLDDAMAKTPERARDFLSDLLARAQEKEHLEYELLKQNLPASVSLTQDGLFKPWDHRYTLEHYKKEHLAVDETAIAEYFPMESTIKGLLSIYEQFMSITLKEKKIAGLWHDEVRLIEVYSADGKDLLGYLLLDLFPRPNKFSHACQSSTVPAIDYGDGKIAPAVSLVIANFTKPTADKPALLHREHDVSTFFHEFGHALHAILGRTKTASFSGTHVKRDFVELPSQMLEEWLWDADILKMISQHYKTGQPLPDELITKIQRLKHFETGYYIMRQGFYARLSLACYLPGADKDVHALVKQLYQDTKPHVAYEPRSRTYTSFGHLMGYGAKYYGYLWSKVYALDLFNVIKQHGLLDKAIGQRYVDEILAKGGSQDPNDLLKTFLGREPNAQAFMQDLGLN